MRASEARLESLLDFVRKEIQNSDTLPLGKEDLITELDDLVRKRRKGVKSTAYIFSRAIGILNTLFMELQIHENWLDGKREGIHISGNREN